MGIRERIQRYRDSGAAADLVRVEVLVPPDTRDQVLSLAERLRDEHRRAKAIRSVNAERVNDRAKLMIHRLLAHRIVSDPGIVDQARDMISRARAAGESYEYLDEWRDVLSRNPTDIRRIITERSDKMYRLRVSSPFALLAGVEDPDLRRRIWRKARQGLAWHGT
jgi:hypothetical protein